MAVAPATTEEKKDPATTASSAPAPAGVEPQPAAQNPIPVAPPPVTVSNVQTHAADSAQVSMAPAPAASVESGDTTKAGTASAPAATAANPSVTMDPAPVAKQEAGDTTKSTKATGAKVTAPKTGLEIQAEALAAVPENIKKMLEGDDPIATREFNMLINGIGPKNQLALEGYAMKLKQANLDGQGAGDALLSMMARDQGYETDQLVAKIGADSAKRLYDLNQWGFAKAQEIAVQQDKMRHDNLDLALKTGQYDAAASIWEEIFPGASFDIGAAKALDPNAQAAFVARFKLINQFIEQGNAEGAKAAMLALAKESPEAFGFKTPEEAVAALQGVDFSKEAWANNNKFNADVNEAIRTDAMQGNHTEAMSAIDRWYANKLPGSADRDGKAAIATLGLDEINAILKANDKAPITEQGRGSLSSEEFAKDKKYYDEKVKATGANGVDLMLKQLTDVHPEIGMDPSLRNAARAWIFDNISGFNISPDGEALLGFSFKEGASLPPWDPNSLSGHLYTTWPTATFNEDGTVKQGISSGGVPYTKESPRGDLTTPLGREHATIDANWEQYVMKTRSDPSTRLTRDAWYYGTKGGTQVDPLKSNKPEDFKPTDTTNTTTGVRTKTSIDPMTGKPVTTTEASPTFIDTLDSLHDPKGLATFLQENPSGIVTLPNKTVAKVESFYDTGSPRYGHAIELTVNGKPVIYNAERNKFLVQTAGEQIRWQEFSTAEESIKEYERLSLPGPTSHWPD